VLVGCSSGFTIIEETGFRFQFDGIGCMRPIDRFRFIVTEIQLFLSFICLREPGLLHGD